MNVSLTPELEAMVCQKVDSGRYHDASDVVREALLLLDDRDRSDRLRAAVIVGLDEVERGDVYPYTPQLREDIRQAARRKLREGKTPNDDVVP